MANVLIHTADEGVTISARAAKRLLEKGDGDAALLYLALLRHHGTVMPRSLAGSCGGTETALKLRKRPSGSWD